MKNETGFAAHLLSTHQRWHAIADEVVDPREICYFFGGDEGPIKIGSTRNLASRINGLKGNTGPIKARLLAIAPGGADRERAYHLQFADHALGGEWFERHPDILAEIDRLSPHPRSLREGL